MVKLCCIPICPNSRADRGVDCYPFPSGDVVTRGKWIAFVGTNPRRFHWKSKYICSDHFHQLDLVERENGRSEPVEGAVPTLYSPDDEEDDVANERDRVMVSVPSSSQPAEKSRSPLKEIGKMRLPFCRICLKKADRLLPFNSKLHNENLLDIIYTITGLTIEEEEDLPTKICARCVEKLDLAFSVRVDFLHHEQILRNLVKNKQLEAHYRTYDSHQNALKSCNEIYLKNLINNAQQHEAFEQPEALLDATEAIKIEPPIVICEDDEFPEGMEEEHLLDEKESNDAKDTLADQEDEDKYKSAPPEECTVKVETDSDDEQTLAAQYVYSWKDLCKPKRIQRKKAYKLSKDLPEPKLIPHTCYVCNTVHDDSEALECHMEEHVKLLPYTCDQCSTDEVPQVLKTLISLNKHLQTHLFPYRCDYCPLRYLSRQAYIGHMRIVHEEDTNKDGYTCDDCGQHFARRAPFRVHVYKHKVIREGKYKCEQCGKVFSGQALLKRHLRIHTGEKPFECKRCGKRFNHESIFQVHKRTHIGEKAHICPECGKKYLISTDLRRHMAEHFPDDPQYQAQATAKWVRDENENSGDGGQRTRRKKGPKERVCEFENCTFKTTSNAKWHYHQATHTQKFQCDVCARRFTTNQMLVKHAETTHEGKVAEKTRPCPYCEKMFSSNQKLRNHMDIHENMRREKCRFCDKSFVQLSNRIAHERIHTGERPYPCRACPAAFISSSGRKKHEKSHPELQE